MASLRRRPGLVGLSGLLVLAALWLTRHDGSRDDGKSGSPRDPFHSGESPAAEDLSEELASGPAKARPFPCDQPFRGALRSRGIEVFTAELTEGTLLRIEIEQRGTDLFSTLIGPSGSILLELDSPNGAWGREEAMLQIRRSGLHELTLESLDPPNSEGEFELSVCQRPVRPEDSRRLEAEMLFHQAEALQRRGGRDALEASLGRYRRLEHLALEHSESHRLFRARLRRGDALRALGRWEEAGEVYRRALSSVRSADTPLDQATAWNRLGLICYRQGLLGAAEALYRRSLELARQAKSRSAEAVALHNLGQVHVASSRYRQAVEAFHRAAEIFLEVGQAGDLANAYNNLGRLYSSLGEPLLARDYLEQALELHLRLGDRRAQAIVLSNLGLQLGRGGEHDAAEDSFRRALELFRSLGDIGGELKALHNLAWVRSGRAPWEETESLYLRASELARRTGDRRAEATIASSRGRAASQRGLHAEARELHSRALKLFAELEIPSGETQAHYGLAVAWRDLGLLDRAEASIRAATERIETIRERMAGDDLGMAYFATQQDIYTFYVELLMQRHRSEPSGGYGLAAYEISERSRARGFLDLQAGPEERALRAEEVLEILNTREEIHALRERLRDPGAGIRDERETGALARRQRRLLERLRRLYGRQPSPGSLPDRPIDLETLRRELLDARTQLLHYHLGVERSFAWVVGPDRFESVELARRDAIESVALDTYRLIRRSGVRRYRQAARRSLAELGALVLAPLMPALEGERLLVVADGALWMIPFAILPAEPTGAEPLLTSFEIVHLPSASTIAVAGSRKPAGRIGPNRVAVLADPAYGDSGRPAASSAAGALDAEMHDWPRLPGTREEAQAIEELVAAENRLVALGPEADRRLLLSGDLARYSVLHFGAHGVLDLEQPELSGLALATRDAAGRPARGFVGLFEIAQLELPAQLVVLSACDTAMGPILRGEGMLGLPRAFLEAGSRAVLVAHWAIRDRPTAHLMRQFYAAFLGSGRSPAAALREAQLALYRRGRPISDWGAFVIQGDWRGPVPRSGRDSRDAR